VVIGKHTVTAHFANVRFTRYLNSVYFEVITGH
jgi:hypothetical protein